MSSSSNANGMTAQPSSAAVSSSEAESTNEGDGDVPSSHPAAAAASSAAAAAAANAKNTTNNDTTTTLAAWWFAMDQLTNVFGFPQDVAQEAIEAVGTADVTTVYNHILDANLAPDAGGPVAPIRDCLHVAHHVRLTPHQLPSPHASVCSYYQETSSTTCSSERTGQAKGERLEDGTCPGSENWVCLQCGAVRCSRYINGHGVMHYEESLKEEPGEDGAGHCIAVSLADLSVWCHACRAYLRHPDLEPLVQRLEELKFDDDEEKKETPKEQRKSEEQTESMMEDDDDDKEAADEAAVGRGIPLSCSGSVDEDEEMEYPFGTLPTDLKGVAKFIQSPECRSIVVLAGAGMSVSSGIPDFRSEGGLYSTMNPDILTASEVEREAIRADPTLALEQGMFLQNPLPCLELKRPFILGTGRKQWEATLAHRFVELLHVKTSKLIRLYTQNIDGLEGQCTGLPREKVVAVHGSMDRAECAFCGATSDFQDFCTRVQRNIKDVTGQDPAAPKESTPITCHACGYAGVKPAIVLFRSSLPMEFFLRVPQDIADVDLLIVIGTSLVVAPANTLVFRVPPVAMRLIVNREPVGRHLGVEYGVESERDFFAQGDCDEVLLDLMTHLGWLEDLSSIVNDLPEASANLLRARLAEAAASKVMNG